MRLYCVVREYFEKYENCGFCLLRILFFRAAYDLPDKYKLIYKNRKIFDLPDKYKLIYKNRKIFLLPKTLF